MSRRTISIEGDVASVPLTRGQTTIIDPTTAEEVGKDNWHAVWIPSTGQYYARRMSKGTAILLHRFLMGFPEGDVDHINGDSLDNRRENLRVVTNKENQENRQKANKNSKTGVRGVCIARDSGYICYRATVGHHGQLHQANFPYTPEGLEAASRWVVEKRLEVFTHSDGR